MVMNIEVLAPARDADVAKAAIDCGADAVYIGAPHHGARAQASVSISDIQRVVEYAHRFGVRVYVALNTLVYDHELQSVEKLIRDLWRVGVDALIVQDLGVLELQLPPIALHASTQCDIRTVKKARMLADAGFTRIVPARELTIEETAAIHTAVPDIEIEEFAHGALCVCYSGDCRASFAVTGRSANRGECSQMCRHAYTLTDAGGRILAQDKYILSLKDLNRSARVEEMLASGVSSLKIEGRLKDADYVMETVGYYRKLVDELIASRPEKWQRASHGKSVLNFVPDVRKAFNRGFTEYFTYGRSLQLKMATLESPGRAGERIGRVKRRLKDGSLTVELLPDAELGNGDGIGWRDVRSGQMKGMRVNRVKGDRIFPAPGTESLPAEGTELLRTADASRARLLSSPGGVSRKIAVSAMLTLTKSGMLVLELSDERGVRCATAIKLEDSDMAPAEKPQEEGRRKVIAKTGDTIYSVESVDDRVGRVFIRASVLTQLRREAVAMLEKTAEATFKRMLPGKRIAGRPADPDLKIANVANGKARNVYRQMGYTDMEEAVETAGTKPGMRVMTTRYCLRRELGHCLKTPKGKEWRGPLTITDASGTSFLTEFDCRACEMNLFLADRKKHKE